MSFVGIDIKVIAWDPAASIVVAEDWLETPPAVDAYNVESYLAGRFGAPLDVTVHASEHFGEIVVGWVFPSAALESVALPAGTHQLLAVPFVRFRDGRRRELFEYNAELDATFIELVGGVQPGWRTDRPAPRELLGRLEDDHLQLASTDPRDVALQLGGWLRRLLAEGWTYLVVELDDTGRYVQFMTHDGDWLRGEAVGDRYLEGHRPLDVRERTELARLGWHPPDDGCGNHWRTWDEGDVDDATEVAASTLCDVFGPVTPSSASVHAGPAQSEVP